MKFARFTVAAAMLVLMLLSSAPVYADTPPIVDGAMYGPGGGTSPDKDTYTYLKTVLGGNAWVYHYHDSSADRYYVAVVLNPNYADNVFDKKDNQGENYMTAVGWGNKNRSFDKLHNSDELGESGWVRFVCPNPLNGDYSYEWIQDLIEATNNNACKADPQGPGCDWESNVTVKSGSSLPPNIATSSSIVWSMKNYTSWDVTLGSTDWGKDWKSPDTDVDSSDSSSAKDWGWGTTWFDDTHNWEWLTVYEMAFDVGQCDGGPGDWTFEVDDAHSSPYKPVWDTCSGDITIIKDASCTGNPNCDINDNFSFTRSFGADFTLDDSDDPADPDPHPNTIAFTDLSAGTYDVTEDISGFDPQTNWSLHTLECTADAGPVVVLFGGVHNGQPFNATFDAGDDTVRITLSTCQNVTCTFGNGYVPPTAVTLSSFDARSSAGGSTNWLWLGLAGLMVLAGGSLFWKKRRVG